VARLKTGAASLGLPPWVALVALTCTSAATAAAAIDSALVVTAVVDRDDDDVNGVPDDEETALRGRAADDVVAFVSGATRIEVDRGAACARPIVNGRPVSWASARGVVKVQGVEPCDVEGTVVRGARRERFVVHARAYGFRGGAGEDVDPTRLHASMERTAPGAAPSDAAAAFDDPDALRVHVSGDEAAPPVVVAQSYGSTGKALDTLEHLPLSPVACRAGEGAHCWSSAPLRLVVDDTDRLQPLVLGRSLRGEVGGALAIRAGGRKLQGIRIAGPRSSPAGPIGRYRVHVRPFVFRVAPGGAPAFGGTDERATSIARSELGLASSTWGQCGVTLGTTADIAVKIVDPPLPSLLSFGDDAGLPASGGELHLRADGKTVVVSWPAGLEVSAVAGKVAAALESAGLKVIVSPNARIGPGAGPSTDLLVHRRGGAPVLLEPSTRDEPLCTDPTLAVRLGAVDLSDGLQHFGDVDAVAGTLEERALVKSIDDGDPTTIDLVFVPFFGGGGRIGESFIGSDASSVENVVLLDRAGVRARRSSFTVAHEMGHVLLDIPGHPDDYGLDTPSSLMDSDAADASAFGPRRLSTEECARVIRESGPGARTPLLTEWKLEPLKY
jgi:hypothetical protein